MAHVDSGEKERVRPPPPASPSVMYPALANAKRMNQMLKHLRV